MSKNFILISKIEYTFPQGSKRLRYIGFDKDGIERSINTETWVNKKVGDRLELVESIDYGRQNIFLNDEYLIHPIFKIGESYKFVFKGVKTKKDENQYFVFLGIDGNEYEIKKFEWMTSFLQDIDSEYNLVFDKIFKGRVILKINLFFESDVIEKISGIKEFLNSDLYEDRKNYKLYKDQYKNRHNNWILSFSNHLADCLYNSRNRKDWLEFKKINLIQSELERWIITSGYLKLFKKEDSDKIKSRIYETRKTNNKLILIIDLILNYKDEEYINNLTNNLDNEQEYILTFLCVFNPNILDNINSFKKIFNISFNFKFKKSNLIPFVNSITSKIYYLNKDFRENNENYTIELHKSKIQELIRLNIFVYNISIVNDLRIKPKLYLVKTLNLLSNYFPETSEFFLKLKKKIFNNCIKLNLITETDINDILNQVKQLNEISIVDNIDLKINSVHKVEIIGKLKNGYIILFNDIFAILPIIYLHRSKIDIIKIGDKIELFIREYFPDINLLIFSSFKNTRIEDNDVNTDDEFGIKDLEFNPNDVIKGVINKVTEYGVFVTFGGKSNGLMHKKNIHPYFVSYFNEYFKFENEIIATIIEVDKKENNISLSNFLLLENFFNQFSVLKKCNVQVLSYNYNFLNLCFDENIIIPLNLNDIELDIKFSFDYVESFSCNLIFKDSIFYFSDIFNLKFKDEYPLVDLKNYFNELSYTSEENALSNNDHDSKIKLLELTKLLYGFSSNNRSYFIQNYITYNKILEDFTTHDKKDQIEEFIFNIEKDTQLLNSFKSFTYILNHLRLILCFEQINEDSFHKLVEFYFKDGYKEISKEILKYNLLSFDKNDINQKIRLKQFLSKEMINQITSEFVFGDMDIDDKEVEVDIKLKEILLLISKGENIQVEFKESLSIPINDKSRISEKIENISHKISTNDMEEVQLDLKNKIFEIQSTKSDVLLHSAFKNIVAFANTKGGDLFIGVDDNGNITGLKPDYSRFYKDINPDDTFNLRDKFRLYLDDQINTWIDPEIRNLIDINFYNYKMNDFCHISVQKKSTKNLLFLYYDIDKKSQSKIDSKTWYYRGIANARQYTAEELVSYYMNLMS